MRWGLESDISPAIGMRLPGRPDSSRAFSLADHELPVRRNSTSLLRAAVGPMDLDLVDDGRVSHTEMEPDVAGRDEAIRTSDFVDLRKAASSYLILAPMLSYSQ